MYQDCLLFIFYWLSLSMAQLKKKRTLISGQGPASGVVQGSAAPAVGCLRSQPGTTALGLGYWGCDGVRVWGFGVLRAPGASRDPGAVPPTQHPRHCRGRGGCACSPGSSLAPAISRLIFPSGF